MSLTEAKRIFGEFLMGKRGFDSEMYEAIRVQYLSDGKREECCKE